MTPTDTEQPSASTAAPLTVSPAAPLAEYLRYKTEQGIGLNALLWTPPQGARGAVLLVPGFYGSFAGGGHDYAPMARALAAQGLAFMAINLRTANDFTDPRLEHAVPDVGAAVAELRRRGFTELVLLGTSLGAPRSLLYLGAGPDPAIRAVGLIAPILSPCEEARLRMSAADLERFDTFLAMCRDRVRQGLGKEVVSFERWFSALTVRMTARGFLNVFGSPADTDISVTRRAPQVTLPIAIFHGSADEIALPPNAQAIHDAFTAAPSRELVWVEGATHTLEPGRGAESYAQAVAAWLARALPPRA